VVNHSSFTANKANLFAILVNSFNSIVGYEKTAEITKLAYATNRPIIDVVKEMTNIDHQALTKLLAPKNLI
jgi:fumarate hydratase class II